MIIAADDLTAWVNNLQMVQVLTTYRYSIEINCHWIDDLDSSGLGSLVQIFKEVRDSGRSIALTGNKRVGQTVKLVRLEEFFCWDNNMESAIYNVTFSQSIEIKLDFFFGEIGADICEVALYLGRMEGKLKARANGLNFSAC